MRRLHLQFCHKTLAMNIQGLGVKNTQELYSNLFSYSGLKTHAHTHTHTLTLKTHTPTHPYTHTHTQALIHSYTQARLPASQIVYSIAVLRGPSRLQAVASPPKSSKGRLQGHFIQRKN